jgi:hypothetical protein
MRRFQFSAALLAFTLPIAAQTPAVQSTPITPGRVIGTILCSDTHKPCRGATVRLTAFTDNADPGDTIGFDTVAGIDGTYAFDNLPPGKYTAIADLPGYLSNHIYISSQPGSQNPVARAAEVAAWVKNLEVVVASAQTSTHDITLFRGASLSGRVLYADGSPAIHAFLRVEHADPDRNTREPDKDHHTVPTDPVTASTNDLGQFRISGIRPGRYRIAAVPRLQDTKRSGVYSPTTFAFYSGDTIHRKVAKVYELRLGDDLGNIDITIPISGLHRVSGHLATQDDHSLNMGTVALTSADDDSILYRTEIDRNGAFTFANVPTGTYALTLTAAFLGTPVDTTKDPLDEDTNLEPTRAFAAETISILVKDSDLLDIDPTLKEIPLPPKPENGQDP